MAQIKPICRFCLNDTNSTVTLFNTETNLVTMITSCVPIYINKDDSLPKTLCETCLDKIKTSYEFREMCLKNEQILRDRLQPSEIKQEIYVKEEIADMEPDEPEIVYLPSHVKEASDSVVAAKPNIHVAVDSTKKLLYLIVKDPIATSGTVGEKKAAPKKTKKKKEFTCGICGKVYFYFSSYKHHILKHRGQKPSVCHTCGKGFMQKSSLKAHQVQHIGEKGDGKGLFSCDFCDKRFKQPSGLKLHKIRHEAEKRSKCDLCKVLVKPFELRAHKQICKGKTE